MGDPDQEPGYGPYPAERDAHDAVLKMAGPGDPPMPSVLSKRQKWQLLGGACEAAQLQLGEHDRRILRWLAEYEDSTVAVIAGLILRAGGQAQLRRRTAPPPNGHSLTYCPECGCGAAFCGMSDGQPSWQCPACYHVFTIDPVTLEWLCT